MELYVIREVSTDKIIQGGFATKKDAKVARNNLNGTRKNAFYVAKGSDHRLYKEQHDEQV